MCAIHSAFPQYGALYIAPFPPAVLAEDVIVVNPPSPSGGRQRPLHPAVLAEDVIMVIPLTRQGVRSVHHHPVVAGGDSSQLLAKQSGAADESIVNCQLKQLLIKIIVVTL